ncbi:hypothetical protein ACVXZ4_02535 [Lacisediminihabitans sp. FW035]
MSLSGIGAARVPGAGMCIPLLMQCGSGQPTPTPTPAPTKGLIPAVPAIPGGVVPAPAAPAPVVGVPDAGAPTFTLPAAQLGGSSISISGLHSVTVVTVPLADGTRTTALRIVADGVTVDDFLLDVRKATGPSLVTNATRMQLRGNVQVYLDSLTATLVDGTALTLGAATPPPGDELPPTMLRVNLGLVGVTASSIAFTAPHQSLK